MGMFKDSTLLTWYFPFCEQPNGRGRLLTSSCVLLVKFCAFPALLLA